VIGRRVRMMKMEIRKRGLRMALEKIRKRGLYCLPPVSIIVLICCFFNF